MHSTRLNLIDNDDFSLDAEYNEKYFILHLPRFNPSKGAVMALKDKLSDLHKMVGVTQWEHIWTGVDPKDDKMKKLMRMVNAEYQGTADGVDVYLYMGEA